LDGTEIKSASHGQSNVLVEFEFHDGSKLEIKEINVGIIQFNKFEIIPKGKNHLQNLCGMKFIFESGKKPIPLTLLSNE
jgi:hypothetical protein